MASIFKKATNEIRSHIIDQCNMTISSFTMFANYLENDIEIDERSVKENETSINYLDKLIVDDVNFEITKGPAAKDLRRLIAYLFIAKDLERIADAAAKVDKLLNDFSKEIKPNKGILLTALKGVIKTIESIKELLLSEESSVVIVEYKKETQLSQVYREIFRNITTDKWLKDKSTEKESEFVSSVLMVFKAIERIEDYYKNILEQLFYIDTGSHLEQDK